MQEMVYILMTQTVDKAIISGKWGHPYIKVYIHFSPWKQEKFPNKHFFEKLSMEEKGGAESLFQ